MVTFLILVPQAYQTNWFFLIATQKGGLSALLVEINYSFVKKLWKRSCLMFSNEINFPACWHFS